VPVDLVAPEPHTSEVLVDAIRAKGWNLQGKTVALQHYGEVNTYLRAELAGMGANVMEISLYEWALPEDTAPLEAAIQTMIKGHTDAVAFTTQSQVRHLLQVADRMGLKDDLKTALRNRVAVAPVGPVCARALTEEDIASHVVPEHPKMGHLVLALADYFTDAAAPARAVTPSPETQGL
jgi:uroporphyrinogen-III synthase